MFQISRVSHKELEARHEAEMNEFLSQSEELATDIHKKAIKIVDLVGGSLQNASDFVLQNEATQDTAFESSETMTQKKIRNLEEPPEGSGINIVTEVRAFSDSVPECAKRNGFWRYNGPAFDQLVKMGVLHLPSEEQLLAHINALPGDAVAKAEVMNGKDEPFPGRLDACFGKLCNRGFSAYWWVISSDGSARFVYLYRGFQDAFSDSSNPRDGFLVPVSSDKI